MITAEFINKVHETLTPHFRAIPFGHAAWSTFYDDEDPVHFRLRLALCYGSTFKYETFDEGEDDTRTAEDVINDWKQVIAEATATTPIDYEGDALVVNYAIGTIVCDTDGAEDIDTDLINHLIRLRDKLHSK